MKESVTSLQSAGNWGHGVALQGIVEDVVSDLQRHHADTGVPLPHMAVDVPPDHRFDGNVAVLRELLSFWFRDAVRAAAGSAAMARTAEVLVTSVEYPDCLEIEIADSGLSLAERQGLGGVVGRVHVSVQQKLLNQVRGDVRLYDCVEGGVAVTLRIPKAVSQRMAA